MSIPITPVIVEDFNTDWAKYVLKDWFSKNEKDAEKIEVLKVKALINGQQVCWFTICF